MTLRILHTLFAVLLAVAPATQAVLGAPLAAGKPKYLGGVHSTAQAVNLTSFWNQVTPENAGKWGSVEAVRDVMNWTALDQAYALAKDNGLPFRFHILVWGNQQPAWIAALPPAEKLEEIQEWYAAVAARYPAIDYLEAVNEPISDAPDGLPGRFDAPGSVDPNDGNYIDALGGSGTTGWDWVINAFRLARAAFPDTPLVMHDYSIINDTTTLSRFIEIVDLLKAEGLVDIIGEQAHSFTIASMQASTLTTNLNTLAATGLPIMITEMDIDGADSTTANDTTQLDRYQRLFPALWEHPAVMGITTWGYRPGMWRANAVLVFADGTERSAMTWLRAYVADSNPPLRPTFTRSPRGLTRDPGQSAVFSASVRGNPAPSLQWQRSTDQGASWSDLGNDATFSGVTTDTLTIGSVTTAMTGHRYRLVGSNSAGAGLTTYAATLTVNDIPFITSQPASATRTAGAATELSVSATGSSLTYQWHRDGTAIPGATGATYTLLSTQSFHAGTYTVVISNTHGSTTSQPATLTVQAAPPSDARLMNISTRGLSLTGSELLIPGFVIQGTGTKRLLLRAVGPTLASFGVGGTLADPTMILKKWNPAIPPSGDYENVTTNDNWGSNANAADITAAAGTVGAFLLAVGSSDAALLLDLEPGQYSVVASGVNNTTGVAIVEAYDVDAGSPNTRLVNISNRGFVGTGSNIMIPGFVVSNEGPRTFLVRAVGPTLGVLGVGGVLADPVLDVFERVAGDPPYDRLILSNDNWDGITGSATTASVAATVGAFPLAAGSADAAFVVTLPPGIYTVNARGKNESTGIALVEVYLVP